MPRGKKSKKLKKYQEDGIEVSKSTLLVNSWGYHPKRKRRVIDDKLYVQSLSVRVWCADHRRSEDPKDHCEPAVVNLLCDECTLWNIPGRPNIQWDESIKLTGNHSCPYGHGYWILDELAPYGEIEAIIKNKIPKPKQDSDTKEEQPRARKNGWNDEQKDELLSLFERGEDSRGRASRAARAFVKKNPERTKNAVLAQLNKLIDK